MAAPAQDPSRPDLSPSRVASHLGVMLAVAVVMGVVVAGLAIPFAGVLGLGARTVAQAVDELPAELETEALPQRTRVLDADGNLIATLFDENRINVPLTQVSRRMVEAIVSIEDYRFYQHGALDLRGTLRALVTNQANDGVVQGGSSITQQMVKLTLLSQADTEEERLAATDDTYARKLRELRYAIAFEEKYSKDWILERYLNLAYFGDGAYGVQAAARHYFDVNAKKLNLRQSALLAGLVQNPTRFDPTNSPDLARERRNVVLNRMAELGAIEQEQADRVKQKGLGLDVVRTSNGCVDTVAPFFCDYAIEWLLKDPALGKNRAERRSLLLSGGLTIRTTLDQSFQRAADASVRARVFPTDSAIGGLALVVPRTGEVRALAQSRPMGPDKQAGETFLNYVVPEQYGDSRGFQAGSTFKSFVLAAAINQGIPLSTTIESPEQRTFDLSEFTGCEDERFVGTYPVGNSTGSGTFNLYTGTQTSVNTFYIELVKRTGVCEPFELAKSMGVELTNPRGDAQGNGAELVPSFPLGVANASPLEMAEAYATFAGRGLHCDSRPVTSIEDARGNVLKEYPAVCTQVLPSATADAVNDVLRGVQETGFGAQNGLQLDQPSAGKTGTTQDGKSVWFVGYTPQLAGAAMIAGANEFGSPIPLAGQTIGGVYISSASGSGFAGPVWSGAMQVLDDQLEFQDFVRPSGTDIAGVLTPIPDVSGQSLDQATETLEAAGFVVSYGGYRDSSVTADAVAFTFPSAGESLSSGDTVVVYQSDGTPFVPPDRGGRGGGDGDRGNGRGNGAGNGGGNGNGNGGDDD